MKCLLDTHTLLWWVTNPEVLPPSLRDLLDNKSNQLLMSIATPWELAIKTKAGKLDAVQILKAIESDELQSDVAILPTEARHVVRAGMLPLYHRDPFDRLLAAQALELGIPILSRDRVFERYGVKRVWG